MKQYVKMTSLEETSPEATPSSIKSQLPLPEPSDLVQASTVNFDDMEADLKKIDQSVSGELISTIPVCSRKYSPRFSFPDCKLRVAKVVQDSSEQALEPFQSSMTDFLSRGIYRVSLALLRYGIH